MNVLKFFISFFVTAVGISTISYADAQVAQSICNTIEECQVLRAKVTVRLNELRAGKLPALLPIPKNANGDVKHMKYKEAVEYCESQGGRLPSARDWVQQLVNHGARGIMENGCNFYLDSNCKEIRDIQNADGSKDKFDFSRSGYESPSDDLGRWVFWSSSGNSKDPGSVIVLLSRYGILDYDSRNGDNAVLCLSDR